MIEIQPPLRIDLAKNIPSLFLAGSIEMGKAEDWQTKFANELTSWNIAIFNPRRDDWDSSWEQSIKNQQFYEQVNWELDHIESTDFVVFYFDSTSKSPITLMELGICSTLKPDRNIVCGPDGFWRKGNVDMVCERYNIPCVNSLDELISSTKAMIYKLSN